MLEFQSIKRIEYNKIP